MFMVKKRPDFSSRVYIQITDILPAWQVVLLADWLPTDLNLRTRFGVCSPLAASLSPSGDGISLLVPNPLGALQTCKFI